jgi:flagellar biosynthetic protein FlhB
MADSGERTEKATPRRLERARKEGNFPSSKEFVSSVQFLGFVAFMAAYSADGLVHMTHLMRVLLTSAFSGSLTPAGAINIIRHRVAPELVPLLAYGGALVGLVVFAQLAATRLGVSLEKVAPDIQRLNPAKKLASLPSQNLFNFGQALILLLLVSAVVYYEVTENLNSFLELPWLTPRGAMMRVSGVMGTLLWRAAALFLLVGVVDLIWQQRRYNKQLRMSKQEIREEGKEQEGSPQMKMRVRRMQRDLARRKMMQEVPKATAVIVNPEHYAVAIRYSLHSASAPLVVAKGKNHLAQRIRQKAIEHLVPIVENPPLARALYTSVEVGQEIPSHLYRAVAEILAYIYKLMNGRPPG